MITGFRHKGLKLFFEDDDPRRLPPELVDRIRTVLSFLDSAGALNDMQRPSFRLHALKGKLKGIWAVTVRANWRITFRFEGGNVHDVDFVDYH